MSIYKKLLLLILSFILLIGCDINKIEDKQEDEELIKNIEVENGNIKYIHFGNKEGKKVIILPGLSLKSVLLNAEAIVSAYDYLAKDYDIYLFDHLDVEPEGYTIEDMTNDYVEAIKKLKLEKVNMMGVSLGAMISQVMAVNYPELVTSLVLCSATSSVPKGDTSAFVEWKELALERKTRELADSICERIYSSEFNEKYKEAIIASCLDLSEVEYQNFLVSLEAIMSFDIDDQIKQIKCPVIVLGGKKDKLWGEQASLSIIEKLNCEYYIYEDQGHSAYDEAGDFLVHVKDFLDNSLQ